VNESKGKEKTMESNHHATFNRYVESISYMCGNCPNRTNSCMETCDSFRAKDEAFAKKLHKELRISRRLNRRLWKSYSRKLKKEERLNRKLQQLEHLEGE